MRILYSHHGRQGKDGWGRTFYMAQGMARLGHSVTLMTINPKCSFFKINTKLYNNLKIKQFPDFASNKIKASGFAIWSTIIEIFYAVFHKYDLVISDCGHRFTGLPCKINRAIYHSKYFSEWWDFFGSGGYLEKKSKWFRVLYGRIECYSELNDKKNADAVIVLSSFMKRRAREVGIDLNKVYVVPGGSIVNDVTPSFILPQSLHEKIQIAYIGIDENEIDLLSPFIEAIKTNGINKKFKLILYGNKISAEKWDRLELDKCAEYRGWLDYTSDTSTLDDVDVFLQLLDDNNVSKAGWPNKIGDYLAFGKPIILSPYGDLTNFIKNQKGFFVTSYNCNSIIQTLMRIEECTYMELSEMGMANYKLAQTISWEKRAQSVVGIYKKNS